MWQCDKCGGTESFMVDGVVYCAHCTLNAVKIARDALECLELTTPEEAQTADMHFKITKELRDALARIPSEMK